MIGVTLLLVALFVASIWLYSRHRHSYWSSRGVNTPPYSPLFGHFLKIISSKVGRFVFDDEAYRKYGGSHLCGLYEMLKPTLMIGDPELVKHILVKDFDHFVNRRSIKSPNKNDECMNRMLPLHEGEDWKNLRSIMTPTFTSGRLRSMFPLVCEKADALVSFSLQESKRKPFIDMKSNFGNFTMDTIASCAFGIECNSLVNEDAVFAKKAIGFFAITPTRMIKFLIFALVPSLFKLLKLQMNASELFFFKEVAEETLAARRKGQKRGDFLDLLLQTQIVDETKASKQALDDITIVAQCVLFLISGYDTTSSALAFTSYLLAKHPHEQMRLRKEIQEIVKEHGEITYQAIMEAKFLDSCIMESLRLYPTAQMTERVCTKQYVLPGTDIVIEPGMIVQIPIWSLHHDEKYWPDPKAFQPDRFMPENQAAIKNYTHLPFGAGPRNCIAMRFALLEVKVALAKVILAVDMKLAPGSEEMKLITDGGILKPAEGVNLILSSLEEE